MEIKANEIIHKKALLRRLREAGDPAPRGTLRRLEAAGLKIRGGLIVGAELSEALGRLDDRAGEAAQ